MTEIMELRQKFRFIKSIDLETTGLSPSSDKITEYGSYTCDFYENKLSELNFFVNPKIRIPENIVQLTGITNEDVRDAKTFNELSTDILFDLASDQDSTLIIIHNAPFDLGFLKNEFKSIGIDLDRIDLTFLCTKKLSKELNSMGLFDNKGSNSLKHLMQVIGVEDPNHHRSINDCIMCTKLFLKLFGIVNDL